MIVDVTTFIEGECVQVGRQQVYRATENVFLVGKFDEISVVRLVDGSLTGSVVDVITVADAVDSIAAEAKLRSLPRLPEVAFA